MIEELSTENKEDFDEKDVKIAELQERIKQLEQEIKDLKLPQSNILNKIESKGVGRAVELNRLLKDKNRFIDNLSHDLATPLTPILSLLPMIKEDMDDEKTKEVLDVCIRNAEYIKRVVSNTKELADIGSLDFLLKKENLYDIIDESLKKYEVVFRTCNVKVENTLEKEINVKTEKNKLLKLLDHLYSNAVNSMAEGGTLTISSKRVNRENGSFIQISVKDNGKGLTRDQTDRLFDAFYKTDDSRHKLDSTGLGLTICKNIIEKHGGKIWADSHGEGTGSTIHFTVPSTEVVFSRSF